MFINAPKVLLAPIVGANFIFSDKLKVLAPIPLPVPVRRQNSSLLVPNALLAEKRFAGFFIFGIKSVGKLKVSRKRSYYAHIAPKSAHIALTLHS